jgi:hypothetical protein
MKKVINYIKHSFFKSTFEMDHIGDFSKYSYEELCILLSHFKKSVKFNDSAMIATWESERTILVIKYDSDGAFIEKLNEKWK